MEALRQIVIRNPCFCAEQEPQTNTPRSNGDKNLPTYIINCYFNIFILVEHHIRLERMRQ
jgi:hypothetical protein